MPRPAKNQHVVAVLRQAIGLGQQQLAARIGVSKSYIQKIELNERPLPAEAAKRIADHTGVAVDWLMAGNYRIPPSAAVGGRLTRERFDRHRAWKDEVKPATDKQMASFNKFAKGCSVGVQGVRQRVSDDPAERGRKLEGMEGAEMTLVVERNGRRVKLPKDLQAISRSLVKRLECDQHLGLRRVRVAQIRGRLDEIIQTVFVHEDADFLLWQLQQKLGEFVAKLTKATQRD